MKKIFYLLCLILSFYYASAQEETSRETIYSFLPQYLINRGIRIDVDKQIGRRHYLQICPQFYLSEKHEGDLVLDKNKYSYLIGGGLNLYHKIFAFEEFKDYGLYLSYGLSYNYFHVEYTDDSGGNNVLISAEGEIHKIGSDLTIGYQFFIRRVVALDFFTGLGTRISFMDAGGADTDRFNTGYFGYNYTGNILLLGMRIGVVL